MFASKFSTLHERGLRPDVRPSIGLMALNIEYENTLKIKLVNVVNIDNSIKFHHHSSFFSLYRAARGTPHIKYLNTVKRRLIGDPRGRRSACARVPHEKKIGRANPDMLEI
jgi:hypothetical protein